MPLVPCLYTGSPGELFDPETGRSIDLVPNETIVELDADVADSSPLFWPVDDDGKILPPKKRRTKAPQDPTPDETGDA